MAILLGLLISAPGMASVVIIGLLLFLFTLPLLLKRHHVLLIVLWNSAFNVFFLPAQPHFWLLLSVPQFRDFLVEQHHGPAEFHQGPPNSRDP